VHKNFWHLSFLTATTGWLCPVAALLVPFVLVSNVYKYVIACLTLKPVPPQAEPPTLTSEAREKLQPFRRQIESSLQSGSNAQRLASQVAPLAGVSPGQVMLFIWAIRGERQLSKNSGYVVELLPTSRPAASDSSAAWFNPAALLEVAKRTPAP
jgi:hypothetical protein